MAFSHSTRRAESSTGWRWTRERVTGAGSADRWGQCAFPATLCDREDGIPSSRTSTDEERRSGRRSHARPAPTGRAGSASSRRRPVPDSRAGPRRGEPLPRAGRCGRVGEEQQVMRQQLVPPHKALHNSVMSPATISLRLSGSRDFKSKRRKSNFHRTASLSNTTILPKNLRRVAT